VLRRLAPHVASAAQWWEARDAWIAVGITFAGLTVLGLPETSLQSFPEAFRVGMAGRADKLGDVGVNDPKNWDAPFGTGQVHMQLAIFSDTETKWRGFLEMARQQYQGIPGVKVLMTQDFGAQPGSLNSFGYKDGIAQPA